MVVLGKPFRNLALGKTATQVSTFSGNVASRAVNGNVNGALAGASVAQTTAATNRWWQVDLGSVKRVEDVEVWNRTDAQAVGWLQNFYVFASQTPFSGSLSAILAQPGVTVIHEPGAAGTAKVFDVGVDARYVRVQLSGTSSLALSEVIVSGRAVP